MTPLQPTTGPAERGEAEFVDGQPGAKGSLRWRARAVREGGRVNWEGFDVPASELAESVFGLRSAANAGELWSKVTAPDLAVMNARSQQALVSGRKGYEQEFRVVRGPPALLAAREGRDPADRRRFLGA